MNNVVNCNLVLMCYCITPCTLCIGTIEVAIYCYCFIEIKLYNVS